MYTLKNMAIHELALLATYWVCTYAHTLYVDLYVYIYIYILTHTYRGGLYNYGSRTWPSMSWHCSQLTGYERMDTSLSLSMYIYIHIERKNYKPI